MPTGNVQQFADTADITQVHVVVSENNVKGTQFTGFTSTRVQLLTPMALRRRSHRPTAHQHARFHNGARGRVQIRAHNRREGAELSDASRAQAAVLQVASGLIH